MAIFSSPKPTQCRRRRGSYPVTTNIGWCGQNNRANYGRPVWKEQHHFLLFGQVLVLVFFCWKLVTHIILLSYAIFYFVFGSCSLLLHLRWQCRIYGDVHHTAHVVVVAVVGGATMYCWCIPPLRPVFFRVWPFNQLDLSPTRVRDQVQSNGARNQGFYQYLSARTHREVRDDQEAWRGRKRGMDAC